GLPPETRFDGRSLAPRARGQDATVRDVIAELVPNGNPLAHHRATILRGRRKLIRFREETPPVDDELFDLATDPHETTPLGTGMAAGDFVPMANALTDALARFDARAARPEIDRNVPESTRERLRALGYAVP